jgi:hypothetical protein
MTLKTPQAETPDVDTPHATYPNAVDQISAFNKALTQRFWHDTGGQTM